MAMTTTVAADQQKKKCRARGSTAIVYDGTDASADPTIAARSTRRIASRWGPSRGDRYVDEEEHPAGDERHDARVEMATPQPFVGALGERVVHREALDLPI